MYNKKCTLLWKRTLFLINKFKIVAYICHNNDGEDKSSLVSLAVFVPQIHIRDKRAVFRKRDNSK